MRRWERCATRSDRFLASTRSQDSEKQRRVALRPQRIMSSLARIASQLKRSSRNETDQTPARLCPGEFARPDGVRSTVEKDQSGLQGRETEERPASAAG